MNTKAQHTPTPWINSGNRIYMGAAMERREVAVATKADPSIRHSAEANAAFIVRACNNHAALITALCAAVEFLPSYLADDVRAAIAAAGEGA